MLLLSGRTSLGRAHQEVLVNSLGESWHFFARALLFTKCLYRLDLSSSSLNLGRYHYLHFTDKKIEIQN